MFGVALDGHHVDRLRLVRVHVDDKAEICRQVAADPRPLLARIVRTHDVPVLLHEQRMGAMGMHGDVVHAMAYLGLRIGQKLRIKSLVDGHPGAAAVIAAKGSCCGDRDVHALVVGRIEDDGMQAHAARAGLPGRPGAVLAQAGKFGP